jgi:aryl-alcohol dehydrogenase-like predicted oxidoreductase
VLVGTRSNGTDPEVVDTSTAPIPLLPEAVLPASLSPHSLDLWGRRLGQSPLQLFPLALGSGSFGRSADDRAAADIIDRFIDLGGNFLDATGSHPDGRSELIVGKWMRNRRRRPGILVGTTIGNHHDLSKDPTRVITRAVEGALERMRRDQLDLLSVHLNGRAQAEEVLVAVDDLVHSGKVRFVAANAPTADQLIEARIIAAQAGVAPLVAVQADYNLVHRAGYEPELSRVVALQGSGFMPRQPLAGGLLASGQHSRQDLARLRLCIASTLPPKRWPQLTSALASIGADLGVTAPAVALAWLLTRPGVTAPIVSASSPHHVDDAMVAVRIQLTRQQTCELDRLSR